VAIASLKGDKTLSELSQQFDVHPNQISDWKTQLMDRSAQIFGDSSAKVAEPDIKTLYAKIGQLTLENDFLEHALTKAGLLSARR
jgi:transposase-like protein